MVKKVAIVTFWSHVAQEHCQQLKKLFADKIEVEAYSFDINNIDTIINADLIIISLYSIYVTIKKYIPDQSHVVIINTTISATNYDKIMNIPAGEKVLVVNYSSEMTMETIALFYKLGIHHIEFIPFYPGIKNVSEVKIAVTPGERKHVPSFAKSVLDIGNRVLDISTIVDIAVKLNLDYILQEEQCIEYFSSLKANSSGIEVLLGRTNTLESELDSLFNVLDDGIIGVDVDGSIHAFNKRAEKIVGYSKTEVLGKNSKSILPQIPFRHVIATSESIKAKLIKINDCNISVTIVPIIFSKKTTGALAIINEFTEQEKNQHKLRMQLIGKGLKAKYKFEDIFGESLEMIALKNMARKMAKSDSSVLISGESGTGKELFAQAIHHSSKRRDYPFVAVNCAALPESLLESELFGYEEGSFTGARKGGKLGLFELAHKGSIFLDEIGEMALNLQARLLRVIQEREVMRIGGDSVIKVDIRIISATNKDLRKLVHEGKFRKDLFYRLNVLPLETIPLRKRKEDIIPLVNMIKNELDAKFSLTKKAIDVFEDFSWEGNVRELKNCIEYLAHLDKAIIDWEDMPFVKYEDNDMFIMNDMDRDIVEKFLKLIRHNEKKYYFVLERLHDSLKYKKRIGRRSIVELSEEKGIYLSENEIRRMLNILKDWDMVALSNGRGGTQITELGVKALNRIRTGLNG